MFTNPWKRLLMLNLLCGLALAAYGQRTYKDHSVLASGTWQRVAVGSEGVFQMDAAFLISLGFNGSIPSSQVRIFGRREAMVPEDNAIPRTDDLEEIAIQVVDGGDGVFNGSDRLFFYSPGPHRWSKDSANKRFTHQTNLYSEVVYYYITVGGSGKRIGLQPLPVPGGIAVNSFDERYFHELDSVNFLNSGKEWYGEEMSNLPGRSLSRRFPVPSSDALSGQPATLVVNAAARSLNIVSFFNISLTGAPLGQLPVPALGGGLFDLFAQSAQSSFSTSLPSGNPEVTMTYQPGSFNSQGWLNWFELFYRRSLRMPGNLLLFRDWNSVGNTTASFNITNANAQTFVWDVTDPMLPVQMNTAHSGGTTSFGNDALRLREYVAFSGNLPSPIAAGSVPNQDLHSTEPTDYLIITPREFSAQASRLASFHTNRGLKVKIATTEEIFHEFSGGIKDPGAIRDYAKMYYDRYRSAWSQSGKYMLLLGKGSFDYKDRVRNNTNIVPVYESVSSLDPLSSYTSDDFFGFLDDHEDINSGVVVNLLDIGIGRIPAISATEVKNFVEKVEAYHAPQAFGPWRTHLNFVADDEDQNIHLQDAEIIANSVAAVAPEFNLYKIYLDAFRQEGSAAGQRYPQVNEAINNHIYNGTLIWNYSGHGGPVRLAEETILDQEMVNAWNNPYRLPLFITATCNFAPYDLPGIVSLGENLIVRPKTGAIAMMSTARVVFAYSNRIMNNNYLNIALQPDTDGRYKTLGEASLAAKNFTYQSSGDIINNRKFSLLGDPAMTLGYPTLEVKATKVNGQDITVQADTLSATELVKLEGEVTDHKGNPQPGFNGVVYLALYDKPQTITALGNDPGSRPPASFQLQTSTLFKGKASVINGKYSFTFRLPKDINYQYGAGKISLYASDGTRDGAGYSRNVIIGGIQSGNSSDKTGPEIRAYLNDETFVNGSITNSNPILIVNLADSSGINTGDAGVDHDIVATLDGDNSKYYVLNDFYETEQDNYQKGSLRFQLPELSPGPHSLKIKAWDAMNNSNEYILEFIVGNKDELMLDHVLNYPNPFTTKTTFWFEHNQPFTELYTKIEVFTVTGKLIKTLSGTIINEGTRSSDIVWDGRDDYGDQIARGVYLYRLTVRTPDGKKASKFQRLVILQ